MKGGQTTLFTSPSVLRLPSQKTFLVILGVSVLGSLFLLATMRVQTFVSRPMYVPPIEPRSEKIKEAVAKGLGCYPVLERASKGRWVPRKVSDEERAVVERLNSRTRADKAIPVNMQRTDGRCGDTNLVEKGRPGSLSWIRALCDPKGARACCYSNHTCVNLTESECRCPGCYDERQQIDAELHTWTPDDPTCKLEQFPDQESVCPVLGGLTVLVIGDSFMHHLFISLGGILRSNYPNGVLNSTDPKIKKEEIESCDTMYRFYHKCSHVIGRNLIECTNKTLLYPGSFWARFQLKDRLYQFKDLLGKPNSYVVFGQGIHDHYIPKITIKKVLTPILDLLKEHTWPKLIWVVPHHPGLMKTPTVPSQNRDNVNKFNLAVNTFLRSKGIPIVDAYNLTEMGVRSYDGTHYGKGVNDVKAQILLNYFREVKEGFP